MHTERTRSYRLHIFDGNYEVLRKRPVVLDLDLDAPMTTGVLMHQLVVLTRAASILENEPMAAPRLEVVDALTGVKVRDVF